MDIHINVRVAKVRDSAPGKVRILFYEAETWNKFVGHIDKATAQQLIEDLQHALSAENGKGAEGDRQE